MSVKLQFMDYTRNLPHPAGRSIAVPQRSEMRKVRTT